MAAARAIAITGAVTASGCSLPDQARPMPSPMLQVRLDTVSLADCAALWSSLAAAAPPDAARLVNASVGFDRQAPVTPIWACPRLAGDPDFGACLLSGRLPSTPVVCVPGAVGRLDPGRSTNHFAHAIGRQDRSVDAHFRFERGSAVSRFTLRLPTVSGMGTPSVVAGAEGVAHLALDGAAGGCVTSTGGDRLCWKQTLCGRIDATCDGVDDDCDGRTDDDFQPTAAAVACQRGRLCAAADPTCDGIDDDCDGVKDEDFRPTAGVRGCMGGIECRASDTTCDAVDDDCDGRTDEDYIPGGPNPPCPTREPCRAQDATCDGVDDDCDGRVDDDYAPRVPACGDQCPSAPTSCAAGKEAIPCQACVGWPAVPGGWMFYLNAYDFDVAADRLCVVPLVAGVGSIGGIACTTAAAGNSSPFTSLAVPAGFTDGCDTIKCGNRVALEASGRVWATRPNGVYRATEGEVLARVADRPPGCAGVITAIEIAGSAAAPRPYVICGPEGGAVDAIGSVHELRLTAADSLWVDLGFSAHSLGSAPSRGFELFFGTPQPSGAVGSSFVRLDGVLPVYVARIGTGYWGQVGGIFMSAAGPFAGGFYQWNGSQIIPVSDFTRPLPVENSLLGRYQRLMAAGTHTPFALPYKVADGGGPGVGGPSPAGQVDVVWILNESLRVESYNLAPIPPKTVGPLDQPPLSL